MIWSDATPSLLFSAWTCALKVEAIYKTVSSGQDQLELKAKERARPVLPAPDDSRPASLVLCTVHYQAEGNDSDQNSRDRQVEKAICLKRSMVPARVALMHTHAIRRRRCFRALVNVGNTGAFRGCFRRSIDNDGSDERLRLGTRDGPCFESSNYSISIVWLLNTGLQIGYISTSRETLNRLPDMAPFVYQVSAVMIKLEC